MNLRMHAKTTGSPGGFTLIELLVVIAIIGALMALLMPALGRARHQGRVTRAKLEMKQIETAWLGYRNDYRKLPTDLTQMNGTAVKILRGQNEGGQNTREIAYMEFSDSMSESGFSDPWGELYQLKFATVNDPNRVQFRLGADLRVLHRPVAVWSIGYDRANPIEGW